jgi:hypothetical protein
MNWNNIVNEGGEGFVPGASQEPEPLTATEEMDHILAVMAGTSSQDARMAQLRARYNELYESVWSLERTKQARVRWNEEMTRAKREGRKIDLVATQIKLGIIFSELKKAIAHYNL